MRFSICFALTDPTLKEPPSVVSEIFDILLILVFVPKSPRVMLPFCDAIKVIEEIFCKSGKLEVPGTPRVISPSLKVFNEIVLSPCVPVILAASPIIILPSLSFPISILWVSSGSKFNVGIVIFSFPVVLSKNCPTSLMLNDVKSTGVPVLLVHSKNSVAKLFGK